MGKIPEWILRYDAMNYQSSAGKAIRYLIKELEEEKKKKAQMLKELKFYNPDLWTGEDS